MNMSKTYRSVPVKRVEVEKVLAAHAGEFVEAGFDIGKRWVWTTIRFRDGTCLRPWRAGNPLEIGSLVDLLKQAGERVKLRVAMESSGTYGDPLRQALSDAGLVRSARAGRETRLGRSVRRRSLATRWEGCRGRCRVVRHG